MIHVPANCKNDKDYKPKIYQKFQTINEQVTVGEVYEDFQQHFEGVAATVDLKACVCYFPSNDRPSKTMKNVLLFCLKSSFCSQDI